MKVGKLVKTAIKWAPVIYPVVKKLINSKSSTSSATTSTRQK